MSLSCKPAPAAAGIRVTGGSAKNSSAAGTVISNTSAIERPPSWCCCASGLKRRPWHGSDLVVTHEREAGEDDTRPERPAGAARVGAKAGALCPSPALAGLTGVPSDPLYAANKHAVVGLARSLGPALAERGVRFNAVCPGFAESRIIDRFAVCWIRLECPSSPRRKWPPR